MVALTRRNHELPERERKEYTNKPRRHQKRWCERQLVSMCPSQATQIVYSAGRCVFSTNTANHSLRQRTHFVCTNRTHFPHSYQTTERLIRSFGSCANHHKITQLFSLALVCVSRDENCPKRFPLHLICLSALVWIMHWKNEQIWQKTKIGGLRISMLFFRFSFLIEIEFVFSISEWNDGRHNWFGCSFRVCQNSG